MDKISDVTIADCEKSTYIKPLRLTYQQVLMASVKYSLKFEKKIANNEFQTL